MTTLLFALAANGAASPQLKPEEMVSQCLAKYYNAASMSARVTQVVRDDAGEVKVVTDLQFKRPEKLYLKQTKTSVKGVSSFLYTSNGRVMTYNRPLEIQSGPKRFEEVAFHPDGRKFSVYECFVVARYSMFDDGQVFNLLIGSSETAKEFVQAFKTLKAEPDAEVDGKKVHVVSGIMLMRGASTNIEVPYKLYLSENCELVGYGYTHTTTFPHPDINVQQMIKATYNVTYKVDSVVMNGEVKETLFNPIK